MKEESFSNLKKIAKKRESMLDDAIKSMDDIEVKKTENENLIQKYRIAEIKYKTTINELNEVIEIYKKKLDDASGNDEKNDQELIRLRKKILKQETDLSTLKSILDLFIHELGIDRVVDITKIDKKKIESYIGD